MINTTMVLFNYVILSEIVKVKLKISKIALFINLLTSFNKKTLEEFIRTERNIVILFCDKLIQ